MTITHLTALTDEEVEATHEASLRVLDEIGVTLTHPETREILAGAGAAIQGNRVRVPPDLIERALRQCPSQVSIRGRNDQTASLGDGTLHWHNVGGAREVCEPGLHERRPATIQDVQNSARLLDALDGATTLTPFFTPQDVAGPLMSLAMYRHTLPHTAKPLHGPGVQTAAEARYIAQMATLIGPPKETVSIGISPVSPLNLPDHLAEAIIETARLGLPFGPLPCPTTGATAPMSLAGSLVQQNAEVLICIVLAQLVQPGLPIFYCGRLAMMEPRTGASVGGVSELGLVSAATVQIGHRYGLPANVYGFSTDVHVPDFQGGYERVLNALLPALAGADELSGIGMLSGASRGSYTQMVLDSEIAAIIRRLRQGITVDEDALAVEVIAAAMDGSRNFLGQGHTVRYLRSGEVIYSRLADRRTWEEWDRSGRDGMATWAQAEAERLLAEHEVPPLTDDQEQELDAILEEAGHELNAGE